MKIGIGISLTGRQGGDRFTPSAWAAAVTKAGGTYSATALAALMKLDEDLTLFGIKPKLRYLNPRCGNDIIAAKTPLIKRIGSGPDTLVSGTLATWSEVNGLLGGTSGILDTGISATQPGWTTFCAGAYMLSIPGTSPNKFLGTQDGNCGLVVCFQGTGTYGSLMDFNGKRVSVASGFGYGTTFPLGLICGTIDSATEGYMTLNGVIKGFTIGVGGTATAQNIRVNTAAGASGLDFYGDGLTPTDIANLTWIAHEFNTDLGRQVTAEGLF